MIKSKSIPKWLQIVLFISGVILLIVGVVRISSGSKGAIVSEAFISKFNEFQGPTAQVGDDLKNVGGLLNGIAAKEQAEKYSGAVADLQTALVKLNDASSGVKSLTSLTSEFGDMVNGLSNQNVRTAGLHFIDISNKRNAIILKTIDDAKQLIDPAITYYDGLAHGKTVKLDQSKFTAATGEFAADEQSIIKISADFDSATQDLAKAGGFALVKK